MILHLPTWDDLQVRYDPRPPQLFFFPPGDSEIRSFGDSEILFFSSFPSNCDSIAVPLFDVLYSTHRVTVSRVDRESPGSSFSYCTVRSTVSNSSITV